jgi:hypothetical protein
MLKQLLFSFTVVILGLALTPAVAVSAPITWTIQDGQLDAGYGGITGSIYGSFDFDSDFDAFSNINITVEELGNQTNFSDFDLDPFTGFPQFALISGYDGGAGGPFTGAPILLLQFDNDLLAGNSPVGIESFSFFGECLNDICHEASGAYNVSGSVVSSVPLPAAAWLFGSAMLGLIGVARRRKV